jgi:hypothetical protein
MASAVLEITERGTAMLKYVLLALDYWGYLAYHPASPPLLFELPPRDVLSYVDKVLEHLRAVATAHVRSWIELIAPEMPRSGETPFASYARQFAVKDAFYLRRVADSHFTALGLYAFETLRGAETGIMMTEQQREEFLKTWTVEGECARPEELGRDQNPSMQMLRDDEKWLRTHVTQGGDAGDTLSGILDRMEGYEQMSAGFRLLEAMPREQVTRTNWEKFSSEYFTGNKRDT